MKHAQIKFPLFSFWTVQNLVHYLLKGTPCIPKSKRKRQELKENKMVMMAVFGMSSGFFKIWKYPFLKSILKIFESSAAEKSIMLGRE